MTEDLLQLANKTQFNLTGGTRKVGWQFKRLSSGLSANVDVVTLHCGEKRVDVLPTRGMGIWQASNQGTRFGWNSPVKGPVHPAFVPVAEPSGIGWLDGFDELLVRCGLASNGAPEFNEQGGLVWPLHGRIANLPASSLSVDVNESAGTIKLTGTVEETRFHIQRLQLTTEIQLRLDSDEIEINDTITNLSNRPASCQMLYHCNFGPPILESGSEVHLPAKRIVPRNSHAASDVGTWSQYGEADPNYAEQVYFCELAQNKNGETQTLLTNQAATTGASIRYNQSTLPCFTVWKNTVGNSDGYVTGLEPATNFPNIRSFEEAHGRVVPLKPQESITFNLAIGMLIDSESVSSVKSAISELAPEAPTIENGPTPEWCAP